MIRIKMKNNDLNKDDLISDEDTEKDAKQTNSTRDNDLERNIIRYPSLQNDNRMLYYENDEFGIRNESYYGMEAANKTMQKPRSRSVYEQNMYEPIPDYEKRHGANTYFNDYPTVRTAKQYYSGDNYNSLYSKSSEHSPNGRYSLPHQNYISPQEYINTQNFARSNTIASYENDQKRKAKIRICSNCQTRNTPSWRRSVDGRLLLCNACGLYQKLHNRPRPFNVTPDGKTKAIKVGLDKIKCKNCQVTESSFWRKNFDGQPLCNLCGLYFKQIMQQEKNSGSHERRDMEMREKYYDPDPYRNYTYETQTLPGYNESDLQKQYEFHHYDKNLNIVNDQSDNRNDYNRYPTNEYDYYTHQYEDNNMQYKKSLDGKDEFREDDEDSYKTTKRNSGSGVNDSNNNDFKRNSGQGKQ